MGKVKNLEKKNKPAAEFDKISPEKRVKSINDGKQKKKANLQKKVVKVGGSIEKEVKPLAKAAAKDISKALKAKKLLLNPDPKKTVVVPDALVTREILKKAVKAAKDGINKEKEDTTVKTLFDDEVRYGLQVVSVKIPKTPPHTKNILLDHSLFGDEQPDICFIIRDQKDKKDDNAVQESIMKFEELLKEAGVEGIKTILPLSKLKKDYGANNMKMKLLNTYDVFLVESEIAEHTYSILGKHFITKRKRPHQVDTTKKETMKISVENAKKKVAFKVSSNSNLAVFPVGTHKTDNSKIVDNILSALEQLKEKWLGGWQNILRLYLKPMTKSKVSIPIYYSKINPNDVEVPVEVGVKQTRLDKLTEQLAKKSKKLRIDSKSKRIVKAKGQAPPTKKLKEKKDKKRKLTEGSEVADVQPVTTETDATSGKKSKKDKKTPAITDEAIVDSSEPKKKKSKVTEPEVVAEVSKKGKNKKEKPQTEAAVTEETVKKSKKDKKTPVIVEATESKKGKKNTAPEVVAEVPKEGKTKKEKPQHGAKPEKNADNKKQKSVKVDVQEVEEKPAKAQKKNKK